MKNYFSMALVALMVFALAACKEKKPEKITELKTPEAKLGYALGSDVGKSFKTFRENNINFDVEAFMQGFDDGLNDGKPLMTPDEIKTTQKETIAKLRQSMQAKKTESADKNLKDGETFLAENSKKEGITVTESGLQYQVLTAGDGPKPAATDTVKVHYKGTLIDGKEFDSSYSRGKPAEFRVTGVIKGWTEALLLMPVGSKWKLFIPGKLAYGARGAGKDIGPNATLIFEVELLEIVKKETPAAQKPKAGAKK